MPATRVTSQSPWHVVLVLDDSGSMGGQPAALLNEALRAMIAEMEVVAKGTKSYFKMSIVEFGSSASIRAEARSEKDIDADSVATFSGSSGSTNAADALRAAGDILRRHPGKESDFRPYVFFMSDGRPDDEQTAISAAAQLKALKIAAGSPTVVALGLGDGVYDDFLMAVASSPELYKRLEAPADLVKFFPAIGTIAGSRTGEAQINQAIANL